MIVQSARQLITCVIGGTGFIGQAVVQELLVQGRRVLVLGRRQVLQEALPPGVQYVVNDGSDELLRRVLQQTDEIVDLAYATVPQTSFQDPVNDILTNLPSTVRLFELAAQASLSKFVWISSGGTVYGHSAVAYQSEEHPTNPVSPYGITKLAIEKYARLFYETCGLPVVCVRPSNAFGEGQRAYSGQGFIGTAIASILDGKVLSLYGEKGTVRDYLHVYDMARGIVAALLRGQPGEVYNVGSGQGLNNRQVLDALAPLAAAAGAAVQVQILPERSFDVPLNVLDSRKLTAHTGWTPTMEFPVALAKTWEWCVSQHQLTERQRHLAN
ncbi:NAD-dependent epimerase/dehydratase family protein [Hymenobacter sp. BT664]|uniref:NAD-dependent epimerase/dehydratase family protein n=1 Tax=Hymenobacter montanus TaxID=2771359 RepID=A0A927B9W9_9BACT|nr:NAD-dependent epimerase/dehydratase family protein [Hymenobacter montanus]MBD2766425.1 NAD-dependent epimerase/dehydratase family protein [Hymenobacter montanus]